MKFFWLKNIFELSTAIFQKSWGKLSLHGCSFLTSLLGSGFKFLPFDQSTMYLLPAAKFVEVFCYRLFDFHVEIPIGYKKSEVKTWRSSTELAFLLVTKIRVQRHCAFKFRVSQRNSFVDCVIIFCWYFFLRLFLIRIDANYWRISYILTSLKKHEKWEGRGKKKYGITLVTRLSDFCVEMWSMLTMAFAAPVSLWCTRNAAALRMLLRNHGSYCACCCCCSLNSYVFFLFCFFFNMRGISSKKRRQLALAHSSNTLE